MAIVHAFAVVDRRFVLCNERFEFLYFGVGRDRVWIVTLLIDVGEFELAIDSLQRLLTQLDAVLFVLSFNPIGCLAALRTVQSQLTATARLERLFGLLWLFASCTNRFSWHLIFFLLLRIKIKIKYKPKRKMKKRTHKEIEVQPCDKPESLTGAVVVPTKEGLLIDSDESRLYMFDKLLKDATLADYVEAALEVKRPSGKTIFGTVKPRDEVCYISDHNHNRAEKKPYTYKGVNHKTLRYPNHVLLVASKIQSILSHRIPHHGCHRLWTANDTLLCDKHSRGGFIDAHSDVDIHNLNLVVIFSLGQSRWLRIRNKETLRYTNVLLPHNSLVVMYGPKFQQNFTHELIRLTPSDVIWRHLSLEIRFLKGSAWYNSERQFFPQSNKEKMEDIDD